MKYFDEESGVPFVYECVSDGIDLRVCFSYNDHVLPLPEWLHRVDNFGVTRVSELDNFASYPKQKREE